MCSLTLWVSNPTVMAAANTLLPPPRCCSNLSRSPVPPAAQQTRRFQSHCRHGRRLSRLVKRTPIPSSFANAVKGARRAFISTLDSDRERIQSATGTKLASFLSGRFSLSDFPTAASTKGSLVDNHRSQAFRPDPNIYPATTLTMINLFRLPLARERGAQSS
jgi:hypothetical protein